MASGRSLSGDWTGTAGDDWFEPTNWDPDSNYPQEGESVIINSGSVLLSASTENLASFTIANATLAFTNWSTQLQAENVNIQSGGRLQPAVGFLDTEMSNRVFVVASNLFIHSGGFIDADGLGFRADGTTVSGPGAGNTSNSRGFGGSYGGIGGRANAEKLYGSTNAPLDPGSTGGWGHGAGSAGDGGGAIRIIADKLTVNGTITANGNNGGQYGGGGSGGGIYITCNQFSGTGGVIRANGGTGQQSNSGTGGGGRIAVDCPEFIFPLTVIFSVRPGMASGTVGQMGTLYFPDDAVLSETVSQFDGVRLVIPGFTSWNVTNLTVQTGPVVLPIPDFSLTVVSNLTVSANAWLGLGSDPIVSRTSTGTATAIHGSLATNVAVSVGKNLLLDGGTLTLGGDLQTGQSSLSVNGDMEISNGAALHVYSGTSNSVNRYGGNVTVAGTTTTSNDGWIMPHSHPTNGGAVLLEFDHLVIEENSGVNANDKGYAWVSGSCYAPSFGGSSGSRGAGSGHGGAGGSRTSAAGGSPYGSANAPLQPGAPGGFGHSTGFAQPGGGAVRIHAASMVLDGEIRASQTLANVYGGGGGGGGVFITAGTLSGAETGAIRADGGNGGHHSQTGGGGGGRISLAIGFSDVDIDNLILGQPVAGMVDVPSYDPYLGIFSVTNGLGNGGNDGTPGSVRILKISAGYTVTVAGSPAEYGDPVPGYQNWIDIPSGSFFTNSVETPADEHDGLRRANIGWTLAVTGEEPFYTNTQSTLAVFEVTNNLTITWLWTNEYELVVSTSTGGGAHTASNGWHKHGTVIEGLTAQADANYSFNQWVGYEAPRGHQTANPLTVTMDQPRRITATFYSTSSGITRTWTGNGGWQYPGTHWSPIGRPGPLDTAVLASGHCQIEQAENLHRLEVQSGAVLAFSNWNSRIETTEDMLILSNGVVTVTGYYTPLEMSNRVWMVCRDFTVQEGGMVEVDAKGYFTHTGTGKGGGGGSNFGSGAGHGGVGGASSTAAGGPIYGVTNAPTEPGSGGGGTHNNLAGHGGGVVLLEALRNMVVDGTISANGGNGGQYNGGGSGGSILLIAGESFTGGASGIVRANGGNRGSAYTSLGGGAGGRIAIWHRAHTIDNDVRETLMQGGLVDRLEITETLPAYLGIATASAAELSHAPPQDGTVVFLRRLPTPGSLFMIR